MRVPSAYPSCVRRDVKSCLLETLEVVLPGDPYCVCRSLWIAVSVLPYRYEFYPRRNDGLLRFP